MLRRLAILIAVFALVGCSDSYRLPTEVTAQENIGEDPTSLPPDACVDYIVADDLSVDDGFARIPECVNGPYWPGDGTLFNRVRHSYETVTVTGNVSPTNKGRLF
jgi:hypothetical protein